MTWFDNSSHRSAHHNTDDSMALANTDLHELTQLKTLPPDLDSVANYRLEQIGVTLE